MADPQIVIDRLVKGTNAQDLDAMVGCFCADYVNVAPAYGAQLHRERTGADELAERCLTRH